MKATMTKINLAYLNIAKMMMIKRPGYDGPSNFMRKVQSTGMANGFMKKGQPYRGVTLSMTPAIAGAARQNTLERK